MIELTDLLGLPWKRGAHGPEAYDCWGLVWEVQRRLGVDVPMILDPPASVLGVAKLFRDSDVRDMLTEVERPVHGSIVEMSHSARPYHVGAYLDIDRGGIIHSIGKLGVQFDRMPNLKAAGWSNFTYYVIE